MCDDWVDDPWEDGLDDAAIRERFADMLVLFARQLELSAEDAPGLGPKNRRRIREKSAALRHEAECVRDYLEPVQRITLSALWDIEDREQRFTAWEEAERPVPYFEWKPDEADLRAR